MQSLTTAQQQKNGAAEAKPPRPYTEYNIFFQLEREHMLQRGASASTRATEANMLYNGIEMPPRYRNLVLPSEWHISGKKKTKRKHRKTHGMVSFTDLTKIISNRWKAVDPETKSYCKQMAAIELARYKEVMETYTAKYGKPVRVYKKRKQASPASTKKPEQGRAPSPVKSSSTPAACTRDATAALNMTCAPCFVESNAALSAELSHNGHLPSHPYEAQHKRQRMTPSSTAVQPLHASSQHDIISQPQQQHFSFPGNDPNYEIKLEEDIDLFLDSFAKEERDLQMAGGSSSSAPSAFDGSQLHPEDLHDDEMLNLFDLIADHAPSTSSSAPAPAPASTSQCPHERLNLRELELQKREEELRKREQQLQQQFRAAAFDRQPQQPMSAVDRFWMDAPGLSA